MRKSTLFISAALTTFMLAVLFGVVSAYKGISTSTEVAAAPSQPVSPVAAVVDQPVAAVVPTQAVNVAPEAAAAIASKVIGRTDLYSVEKVQFEGVDAYLVTFSSGDLVYIGMDGQVLSISKLPVTVIAQTGKGGGNNGNGGTSNGSGGGQHETSEHEGGDD